MDGGSSRGEGESEYIRLLRGDNFRARTKVSTTHISNNHS